MIIFHSNTTETLSACFLLGTCGSIYQSSAADDICLKHVLLGFALKGHVLRLEAAIFNALFP